MTECKPLPLLLRRRRPRRRRLALAMAMTVTATVLPRVAVSMPIAGSVAVVLCGFLISCAAGVWRAGSRAGAAPATAATAATAVALAAALAAAALVTVAVAVAVAVAICHHAFRVRPGPSRKSGHPTSARTPDASTSPAAAAAARPSARSPLQPPPRMRCLRRRPRLGR